MKARDSLELVIQGRAVNLAGGKLEGLLDPTILCYLVGLVSGLVKSDLRLPRSSYEFVSIYLLLAIGLKGGEKLAETNIAEFLPAFCGTLAIGILIPTLAFWILKASKRFSREDAGSIAAHYGSVSAVTFATAISFMDLHKEYYESYVTTLMVILEIPALCVGVYLAKGGFKSVESRWKLVSEVLFGKSIFLLAGGLFVGYVSGPERIQGVAPLFHDLFKGFLSLFLLEMGVVTSNQMMQLKKTGPFLLVFGIGMPIISASIGATVGILTGMSLGGTYLLTILAASSSYIAAPSAMRIAVPEASPTLSLTASLAITFPFNIAIGVPFYYAVLSKIF